MTKIFNKLVRDKIVEIIEKDDQRPCFRILAEKDYQKELLNKIIEEAKEVKGATGKEELVKEIGDVQEVIAAIIKANGLDAKEIERIRKQRCKERGGFEKRIYLEKIN